MFQPNCFDDLNLQFYLNVVQIFNKKHKNKNKSVFLVITMIQKYTKLARMGWFTNSNRLKYSDINNILKNKTNLEIQELEIQQTLIFN